MLHVGKFRFKELYLTAGLYVVLLGLSIRAYLDWRASLRTTTDFVVQVS